MNAMQYRGYTARVEYDLDDRLFIGRLAGIRDIAMLDVQTLFHAQRFKARGLLSCTHHRLDLAQGARESCGETVRQEAEGAVTLGTAPARHPRARRGNPFVGPMARKPATAVRMKGTARKTCLLPGFLANVVRAGEMTLEAQLHRPPARTIAPVAGLFV